MKNKYIVKLTGEDGVPMHEGNNVPRLFTSADTAFGLGQKMSGVMVYNDAFVVDQLQHDPEDEDGEVDLETNVPIYVGYNGAKWVREWWMHICMMVLGATPYDKDKLRTYVGFIPDEHPFKRVIAMHVEHFIHEQEYNLVTSIHIDDVRACTDAEFAEVVRADPNGLSEMADKMGEAYTANGDFWDAIAIFSEEMYPEEYAAYEQRSEAKDEEDDDE